jgi:Ca2+-binding RTX toxin-like protein
MTSSQMIESLETRRLLSGTPSATEDGSGMITVQGSDDGNVIIVNQLPDGSVGVVVYTSADPINPAINTIFAKAAGVKINGGAGDDQISFSGQTLVSFINGGDGNDVIFASAQGAVGSQIDGGSGNDQIIVDNSHLDANFNLVAGTAISKVDGGSGDDQIVIQNGSKAIVKGGSGNDVISVLGIDGNQKAWANVDGGSGNDGLIAIDANIIYNGGSGDDTMIAVDSSGTYVGGSGTDALITSGSTITTANVESTTTV